MMQITMLSTFPMSSYIRSDSTRSFSFPLYRLSNRFASPFFHFSFVFSLTKRYKEIPDYANLFHTKRRNGKPEHSPPFSPVYIGSHAYSLKIRNGEDALHDLKIPVQVLPTQWKDLLNMYRQER